MRKYLLIVLSALLLTACSGQSPSQPNENSPQTPVQTPAPAQTESKYATYVGSDYTFQYPKELSLKSDATLTAGKGVEIGGLENYEANTNLKAADIQIVKGDQSTCDKNDFFGELQSTITAKIVNGISFNGGSYEDAGAGQRADATVYSTVHNGKCYKVALISQYSNLDNYDPSSKPKAFDAQKLQNILDEMMSSFQFTN